MRKRLKFDKWFLHKPESVRENETHNISLGLWDTSGSHKFWPKDQTQC